MDKKQIKRIEKMETNLDEARLAVEKLAEAVSGYEEIQDKYYELANYYGSVQWMDDYESDEHFTLEYVMPKTAILSNRTKDHGPVPLQEGKPI